MELGYRSPMTYREADTVNTFKLMNIVSILQYGYTEGIYNDHGQLVRISNENYHQFVYELMQGKDPRESDWWKNLMAQRILP